MIVEVSNFAAVGKRNISRGWQHRKTDSLADCLGEVHAQTEKLRSGQERRRIWIRQVDIELACEAFRGGPIQTGSINTSRPKAIEMSGKIRRVFKRDPD